MTKSSLDRSTSIYMGLEHKIDDQEQREKILMK